MANDVKIRYRSYLPGAGVDSTGAAKQGKMRVVGHIAVTAYEASGEPLAPIELGVSAIDSIQMRVRDQAGSGAGDRREVIYSVTDEQFYLFTVSRSGETNNYPQTTGTETVEFDVLGDSAHDVELL